MGDVGDAVPSFTSRCARHAVVAEKLRDLDDSDMEAILAQAGSHGSGIGGVRSVIDIDGVAVFVKRVPVTALELQPTNYRSTRNMFDMPLECQYGVGSPGFGVWREVAANTMATGLVLSGDLESFAATYHWRVMNGAASTGPLGDELADIDELVSSWHGSPGVRHRADQIVSAPAHVALFLEHIPTTLPEWFTEQVTKGDESAAAAVEFVESCLVRDVAAMNSSGLFHFDAHFDNMLTDGERIYFADFGLAMSPDFELSQAERHFLERNTSHDVCHTITRLVDWLVTWFVGTRGPAERDDFIASITTNSRASDQICPSAWRVIKRYAPVATVINDFYSQLHGGDRTVKYPASAVLRACEEVQLQVPTSVTR